MPKVLLGEGPGETGRKLKLSIEIRRGALDLEFLHLDSGGALLGGYLMPFCLSFLICKITRIEPAHKVLVRIQ